MVYVPVIQEDIAFLFLNVNTFMLLTLIVASNHYLNDIQIQSDPPPQKRLASSQLHQHCKRMNGFALVEWPFERKVTYQNSCILISTFLQNGRQDRIAMIQVMQLNIDC